MNDSGEKMKHSKPQNYQFMLEFARNCIGQSEKQIVDSGIELAVSLTESAIGYLHFFNTDQNTIELVTWSKQTLNFCTANYDRHYPVDRAGLWADSARYKTPMIHNDFQAIPDRQGYPEGHAHLNRHLGCPIVDNSEVVVLIGVGNKAEPYQEDDVALVSEIGRLAWQAVLQARKLHALQLDRESLLAIQEVSPVCRWQWDQDDNRLQLDPVFHSIFSVRKDQQLPTTIEELLDYIDFEDHHKLFKTIANSTANSSFSIHLRGLIRNGEIARLNIKGRIYPRPTGTGLLWNGVIIDITEKTNFDQIEQKAFHDPLTGLANRNKLIDAIATLKNRRRSDPHDRVALHFIDLDYFKPVNDQHGHRFGDEVLKTIARRIETAVRKEDLVVRIGGDEFLILQFGISSDADATTLADSLLKIIADPITINGIDIQLGASIGIAIKLSSEENLLAMIDEADHAMYQSKNHGKQCYTIYSHQEFP